MIAPLFRSVAVLLALAGPALADEALPSPLVSADLLSVPTSVNSMLAVLQPGTRLYAEKSWQGYPLHWAALQNQVDSVTTLLDRGMNADVRDGEGRTPLMAAAAFGSLEVAELLIARGADPMAQDSQNADTPLHFAALAGRIEMAKLLLAHGAAIDAGSSPSEATPLHYAAVYGQMKMIAFLIENGADPDVRDTQGLTPFQYASRRNRAPVMELLTSLGARPDTIFEAINAGDFGRVITHLNKGADVNQSDLFGTPLHRAASNGQVAIMVALIDAGADLEAIGEPEKAHPLHAAALSDRPDAVALLIERGASVDARDAAGRTPLMVACSFGSVQAAAALLADGANPRAIDKAWMDSPIHYAAYAGSVELLKLLVAYGADINARNGNNGATPAHYAARAGHPDVVAYLASAGADLSLRDRTSHTPYGRVGLGDETAEVLRRLGADE
jgi:ankyrin repeat protein